MPEDVELDIYLMNGNKFTISVLSTDETDEVLEVSKIFKFLGHNRPLLPLKKETGERDSFW